MGQGRSPRGRLTSIISEAMSAVWSVFEDAVAAGGEINGVTPGGAVFGKSTGTRQDALIPQARPAERHFDMKQRTYTFSKKEKENRGPLRSNVKGYVCMYGHHI